MRNLFRSKHKITREFGVNASYYSQFGLKAHEGLDLIPTGTDWTVYALADGVVVLDDDNVGSVSADPYGKIVTIWHPELRKATMYCHLEFNLVTLGQQVKQGQAIGKMGSTGNSTGAHVHLNLFETDENGVRLNKNNGYLGGINPLPFIEENVEVAQAQPNNDGKKAVQFDRIVSFLKQISVVFTERSEDYIEDDGLLNAIKRLHEEDQRKAAQIEELKTDLKAVKEHRDESDKAIITLNQKIADLTSAMEKDAVEDKDNLIHAKELEEQRDKANLELAAISQALDFETYEYESVINRIKELKEPKDEAVEYQQKVLDEFWKNLIKGKRTKSLLARIKAYALRYFDGR